jgi:hypothetical protein
MPTIGAVDPIRLLEAVRRYADHTTVPARPWHPRAPELPEILTFVEDNMSRSHALHEGALFHPKVWAIRFARSGRVRFTGSSS